MLAVQTFCLTSARFPSSKLHRGIAISVCHFLSGAHEGVDCTEVEKARTSTPVRAVVQLPPGDSGSQPYLAGALSSGEILPIYSDPVSLTRLLFASTILADSDGVPHKSGIASRPHDKRPPFPGWTSCSPSTRHRYGHHFSAFDARIRCASRNGPHDNIRPPPRRVLFFGRFPSAFPGELLSYPTMLRRRSGFSCPRGILIRCAAACR
jgi:hypothetical protein